MLEILYAVFMKPEQVSITADRNQKKQSDQGNVHEKKNDKSCAHGQNLSALARYGV